jgi:hypothetical protein
LTTRINSETNKISENPTKFARLVRLFWRGLVFRPLGGSTVTYKVLHVWLQSFSCCWAGVELTRPRPVKFKTNFVSKSGIGVLIRGQFAYLIRPNCPVPFANF